MKGTLDKASILLVVIAALNVGAAAVFGYNLLHDVFDGGTLQKVVDVAIGLAGLNIALGMMMDEE